MNWWKAVVILSVPATLQAQASPPIIDMLKREILFENAARFLRLTPEELARWRTR